MTIRDVHVVNASSVLGLARVGAPAWHGLNQCMVVCVCFWWRGRTCLSHRLQLVIRFAAARIGCVVVSIDPSLSATAVRYGDFTCTHLVIY